MSDERSIFNVLAGVAGVIGGLFLLGAVILTISFFVTDHYTTAPDGNLIPEPSIGGFPLSVIPIFVLLSIAFFFFALCAFFVMAVKAYDIEVHTKLISKNSTSILFELQREELAERSSLEAAIKQEEEAQKKEEEALAAAEFLRQQQEKYAERTEHEAEKKAASEERERKKTEARAAKQAHEQSHFSVICPHCKRSIEVPKGYGNRLAKCPNCGKQLQIIEPTASTPV